MPNKGIIVKRSKTKNNSGLSKLSVSLCQTIHFRIYFSRIYSCDTNIIHRPYIWRYLRRHSKKQLQKKNKWQKERLGKRNSWYPKRHHGKPNAVPIQCNTTIFTLTTRSWTMLICTERTDGDFTWINFSR